MLERRERVSDERKPDADRRARGLGTSWTTIHLMMEEAVAEIVGIPCDSTQQACLTPVAYRKGTHFKPALRPDPDAVIDWR